MSRTGLPVPPWGLAVTAMFSVQLGSALSVGLISTVGPAGTAWLRLSMGALVFLALARPPLRSLRRGDLPVLLALGVATGLMTIAFLAAIERIPLGTAVAVEFLGPLTVAAVRSHSRRALAWPALALLGVVLLTEPWHGRIDPAGVGFAAVSAAGWADRVDHVVDAGPDPDAGVGPEPVPGPGPELSGILLRPDGHVVWGGENQSGLVPRLTQWFGIARGSGPPTQLLAAAISFAYGRTPRRRPGAGALPGDDRS